MHDRGTCADGAGLDVQIRRPEVPEMRAAASHYWHSRLLKHSLERRAETRAARYGDQERAAVARIGAKYRPGDWPQAWGIGCLCTCPSTRSRDG